MSDANRVQLAYIVEPTDAFGEKVTGSDLQIIRCNDESLKQDMATVVSEEMRSDRQISDIARVGVSASGGIGFELSHGSHDDFLKAALMAASWSTEQKITNAVTISASSTDNSINDAGNGFGDFAAYQWVYTSGFVNSANNGFFKIASVTAAKLVFSNGTLVTETAGEPITVQMGPQITNGTTFYSYNIEKHFEDLTQVLALFKGMSVNILNLEVPADGIIKGSLDFMGSAEESLTESAGSGSYTAETTTVIMTGANHVTDFLENLGDLAILNFSMSLSNNLRNRLQVGTLGVVSMGSGSVDVTGSLTIHLANATLFDKYLDQDVTSIVLGVRDSAGNGYIIELPSVKLINGTRAAGGINTDVIGDFEFRAYMDATESITIRITSFPVAVYFEGLVAATSTCGPVATLPFV